jgi:hypothetical protein
MLQTTDTPTTTTPQAKPWYFSKIILLSIVGVITYGLDAVTGFLTGAGVTPEQIQIIRDTQPQIAEAVEQYKSGSNILQTTLGVLLPAAIAVVRKWWTNIPLLR